MRFPFILFLGTPEDPAEPTPDPLPTPILNWYTDDAGATVATGNITTIPNRGSLGTSLTPSGTFPQDLSTFPVRTYHNTGAGNFWRLLGLTAAQLSNRFHNQSNFTALGRFWAQNPASGSQVYVTSIFGVNQVGVELSTVASGKMQLSVGNGTATPISFQSINAVPAAAFFDWCIIKTFVTGTTYRYDMYVDGVLAGTGSASNLSSSDAAIGVRFGSTARLGYAGQMLAYDSALAVNQIPAARALLARFS